MGRRSSGRPEWFKFWRRNRAQLDIEQLSMESRGKVFTNIMRYFDEDTDLIEMDSIEALAFNVLKVNVDDSIAEYAETSRQNRENVNKRWHGEGYDRIRPYTTDTKKEDRGQRSEVRSEKDAAKPPRTSFGQYGWVKLSDAQHAKLLEDLGQAELSRCIQYIDEAAQQTGNKNKWKDWNLVLRRCSREGWGLKGQTNQQMPVNDDWKRERVVGWNGEQ